MRNILFLLRSFNAGGAEHQLILLASALQEQGYSVKIAIFYSGAPLEVEAKRRGLEIIDLKRKGHLDMFFFLFRLVDFVRRDKPDILHSYLPVANIWAALIKLFLPKVHVVWGVRASSLDLKQYNWQTRWTQYFEALLSRIPDWIICNSQAGFLHSLTMGYPKSKMSVILNGIDTNRFFPDPELGQRLRKHLNIQENQKLIGMVARIDPMKDYPNFLKASALLIQKGEDVHFVCVGDGPVELISEYKQIASSLGLEKILSWVTHQEDMPGVYNAFDILVSASAYGEGFSNVIGEAMACGIPCVATDVGDSASLIETLGVLVPASNPHALKEGMLKLLQHISQHDSSLADKLVQRIKGNFSVDVLTSRTIQLFENLMASHDKRIVMKNG